MNSTTIISLLAGIIGTITGTCGLILSILNYLRDKPNIQVTLCWDMTFCDSPTRFHDKDKLWGIVSVANIGRRPVFFSHLHLEIPGIKEYLLIIDGLSGEKLLEGDPPKRYPVTQDGLEKYANQWRKIRAVVIDSAGKKYYSQPAQQKPSWAENIK